jgi:Zn-dependent protease
MSDDLLLRVPAILIALTIHEFSHAGVAWLSGDMTARNAGRLTLNPLKHLDLLGTIMLFYGPFGWAKPVPVDPRAFRHPRRDDILVSIAGPVSNIVCALAFGWALRFLIADGPLSGLYTHFVKMLLVYIVELNIGISFFNLLPVPPLDGSHIVAALIPRSRLSSYLRIARYVPLVFFGLASIEWIAHVPALSAVLGPLYKPYNDFLMFLISGR